MNPTAFIFMVNQSEESAEGNSWYSSWKVWARRLELRKKFLYYSQLRHAYMPTVVITSAGQVIVCSSNNVYTPFLYKRLPSGCVSFVEEWEHRRPSYVIHVSLEQHETKRCPTSSIVKRNIVLIPFLLYRQGFGFLLGGTWCDSRLYLRPSWLPLRVWDAWVERTEQATHAPFHYSTQNSWSFSRIIWRYAASVTVVMLAVLTLWPWKWTFK
jgi:hypothetical protein